tara:strand:- start:952 stop:1053 length:102 start_codon:yes stop_codon:yes gene_type:complete
VEKGLGLIGHGVRMMDIVQVILLVGGVRKRYDI